MLYFITFLEGIISFISPCMLPLLPLYISYFAGDDTFADKSKRAGRGSVFVRALFFVAGFTLIFVLLGVFAGVLGSFFVRYKVIVNVITGAIVIFFGLGYLGIIPLNFLKGMKGGRKAGSIISAFTFGLVYSVSLTPCIGAFLGSALAQASAAGTAGTGAVLLICYSLGLGIPFLVSAVLTDRLTGIFKTVKKHYKIINIVCGLFLIAIGILMMTGMLNLWMGALM